MKHASVVLILNDDDDLLAAMGRIFQREGHTVVTARVPEIQRGEQDFIDLLEHHDPKVILYSISPPYQENWIFFRLLRNLKIANGRQFIVTSTNKDTLDRLNGLKDPEQIISKPFELNEIVPAVTAAIQKRH